MLQLCCVDALGPQLGHGGGSGQLELPLLPDGASLAARCAPFMPVVAGNTHLLPESNAALIAGCKNIHNITATHGTSEPLLKPQ